MVAQWDIALLPCSQWGMIFALRFPVSHPKLSSTLHHYTHSNLVPRCLLSPCLPLWSPHLVSHQSPCHDLQWKRAGLRRHCQGGPTRSLKLTPSVTKVECTQDINREFCSEWEKPTGGHRQGTVDSKQVWGEVALRKWK